MTKQRRNRIDRWVVSLGATLCVLIVVVSVASFWRDFTAWPPSGRAVTLSQATVWIVRPFPSGSFRADRIKVSGPLGLWPRSGTGLVVMPTWIFLLVALIPTLVAWRRLRRKYAPGHCRKCGYDLTGNVTGVCSECGTKVDDP